MDLGIYLAVLRNLIIAVILLIIGGCNEANQQVGSTKNRDSATYGSLLDTISEESTVLSRSDECVRGKPEPVLDKVQFPNAYFELMPDGRGLEKVAYSNGDSLIVINWGCEYYNLTFCFVTKNYQAELNDVQYWFAAGFALVKNIQKGVQSAINIEDNLNCLERVIVNKNIGSPILLRFGEPIVCDSSEIGASVIFEKIEVKENGFYRIGVTFSIGPL